MKENKIVKNKKASVVHTTLKVGAILGIVIGLVWAGGGPYPNIVVDDRSWHVVWEGNLAQAAEANPGAAAGGILEIFFVNHSATNLTQNTSATVEGWCTAAGLSYATADDFNKELAHSTAFDIGMKVRANKTQAWRTNKFFDTDVRVRVTSANLGISADTLLSHKVLRNNTADTYIWLMFEDKSNGADGFTLNKDQTASITSIKFECYY